MFTLISITFIELSFSENCLLSGTLYDHGELVSVKKCMDCECNDGYMQCKKIDPKTHCPKLTCPVSQQFSVADNCCKFCKGMFENSHRPII